MLLGNLIHIHYFASIVDDPKKSRIRFQDIRNEVIPYSGLPFIICARYERECVYGIDKHKRAKDRYKRKAEEELKLAKEHAEENAQDLDSYTWDLEIKNMDNRNSELKPK